MSTGFKRILTRTNNRLSDIITNLTDFTPIIDADKSNDENKDTLQAIEKSNMRVQVRSY
jgi:hypothetical protein